MPWSRWLKIQAARIDTHARAHPDNVIDAALQQRLFHTTHEASQVNNHTIGFPTDHQVSTRVA